MNLFTSAELREATELDALVPEWWTLWRACAATPFQSPAWLMPWWRAFAPGTLHVITVRRDAMLVGLAPLYCEQAPQGARLLPIGISVSDYWDVLLHPACAQEAGIALGRRLGSALPAFSECDLSELPPGAAALRLPVPDSCTDELSPHSPCAVLTLAPQGRMRDLVPPRQLQHLRTARNRAARRGEVCIITADSGSRSALFDALVRLHGTRWQSRGETGVLCDPRILTFHREAIAALDDAGLLRLWALRIGSDIAAVYYGLADSGRAYAYLTGFDPDYAFESPGTILIGHALTHALDHGMREFHFLRGREPYKFRWGATLCNNRRRVFRKAACYARAS